MTIPRVSAAAGNPRRRPSSVSSSLSVLTDAAAHAVMTLVGCARLGARPSLIPTAACATCRYRVARRRPHDRIPVRHAREGFSPTGFIRHARRTTDKSLNVGRLVGRNVLGYTRPGGPWVQVQGVGQVLRDRLKGRRPGTTRRTVAPDLGPLERRHFATRHGTPRAGPSSPRG